jgi:hypothetical protein
MSPGIMLVLMFQRDSKRAGVRLHTLTHDQMHARWCSWLLDRATCPFFRALMDQAHEAAEAAMLRARTLTALPVPVAGGRWRVVTVRPREPLQIGDENN